MPYTPAYHVLVASGPHLYVIGGDIGSGPLDKVLVGKIGRGGTIDSWSESPYELPQPLAEHAAVVVGQRIHLLGGTNGKTALRTAYSAEFSTIGTMGAWKSEPNLLPESLRGHAAASFDRSIYVIGGRNEGGTVRSTVYRSALDASGQLQKWEQAGALPQAIAYFASVVSGRQVYLLGGENDNGPVESVFAGFLTSYGELMWRSQRPLPRPLTRGAAFVNGSTLFHVGGYDGTAAVSDAYAAHINADGSIGEWIGWLPLPKGIMGLRATVLYGGAYLAGGYDGGRFINSMQLLPIDTPLPVTTPTPTQTRAQADFVDAALWVSGVVAAVSFLVVMVALWRERRTPV